MKDTATITIRAKRASVLKQIEASWRRGRADQVWLSMSAVNPIGRDFSEGGAINARMAA
jgi:hypothetical protein